MEKTYNSSLIEITYLVSSACRRFLFQSFQSRLSRPGYKLEVVLLEYYIWFFFSGNPENHLDGDVQYVGSVAHTYMRL
jgi:hypothetical protein